MRAVHLALATLAATLTVANGAFPGAMPARGPTPAAATEHPSLSYGRSIGSPTEGRLVGGKHLDETSYLRILPADAAGDVRWGLAPLVDMIDHAARAVRRQFPGTITSVGHLSREGGGEIDRHRSHESGRDADVGFFISTADGRQLLPTHCVPFRSDGAAPGWPGATFDDARNWALLAALLGDPDGRVTHVFVASPLRARLLAFAERVGAPGPLRLRAAEVMQQPHGALPHDDHFHIRIACPAGMSGCVENPAPRPRTLGMTLAHRRPRPGEASRARVTPAPRRVTSQPTPVPGPEGGARRPGEKPQAEPIAPPALLAAPVDDVDG